LVIQNDEIIYERYNQDYDKETITGSFSMAKSVISLMIGRLLDEGKIGSLNDEIINYIPELNKDRMVDVTIKDLLTMSAGIDFTESYWNPFTMTVEIYYGKNLGAILPRLKLKTEPGKTWEYQSISTQLLGHIVKNVSGKSLAEYSRELFWEPMGAESNILWSTDYDGGMEKAFCCINATARDFARLGKLMLQNGRWDTTQIISEEYIKEMTTPADSLKRADGKPTSWYGYQVWLIDKDDNQYPYFRGILGQLIYVIPEKNAVIVRLGKKISNKSNDTEHHLDDYEYLDAGLSLLD
jgi:CubicO group peptidase (beta-lactamase class C family)